METLKEKFEALTHRIQSSGKPAAAWFPQFTPVTLLNAENWWEALAVCEYALDTHEDEALTAGFFELIFSAYDCNVEVDLNEEEYAYWWEKVISVCDRVAVFNGAGWSQTGAQYSEARYGKRDLSLLFPCYEKAAEMGSPEAEATVAYWRYMGFYCEQDRAEGERRFAALSSPEALLWGKYYRAYAEQHTGSKEKAWHAGVWSAANFLGYNYQEEEWLDMPKAIEWLEKGMLYCESYCAYELALIYLYNDEYKNVERGLMCLQRCVDDNYVEAIETLANVYFNGELVEENISYACQLLERAIELGSGSAAYRIGWMYERGLLSEEPDYQKAMEYYEKAVSMDSADGYARAALYLANGYSRSYGCREVKGLL